MFTMAIIPSLRFGQVSMHLNGMFILLQAAGEEIATPARPLLASYPAVDTDRLGEMKPTLRLHWELWTD